MRSRSTSLYRKHRFPPEIVSHAVWLYHRFSLSFREVEELLAERGVNVSYEAVRQWCLKFGQDFSRKLKHRRGQPRDIWHLDELFIRIRGEHYYLWRAVDQDGQVLDILGQKRRSTRAATRFFRKLLSRKVGSDSTYTTKPYGKITKRHLPAAFFLSQRQESH